MTTFDDDPDQETRLKKLRSELESLGGSFSAHPDIPADLEEQFLRQVLEYERGEAITLLKSLTNAGFQVIAPEKIDDGTITLKLWEVIQQMALLGAYLLNTNHLSDRELYEYLYHDALREEAMLFPQNPGYAYVIDLTGSGSAEDMQVFLKHYADEVYRKRWARNWPDDPMPEHEDPPFDRDSRLPQSPLG